MPKAPRSDVCVACDFLSCICCEIHLITWGWSGGAKVLGKLSVPERPTKLGKIVGQGPIAHAVGAGWVVWTYLLWSVFSILSPSLEDGSI